MAAWRRRAMEAFPELRQELRDREFSVYMLFFELLPLAREAHATSDTVTLKKIYGFAEWCLRQKAEALWNAAGVAFYEHVFDERRLWKAVLPWLSPWVIDTCEPLWENMLETEQFTALKRMLRDKKDVGSQRMRPLAKPR